ncbi:putative class-II DAHP synthase family protein [Lyophyllum shimeji]|uniref:Phospho-2-dehydro-3-deoxyheptonate aldolase n=1 Tax=Lyophyllum shimeji TaxID=47721 RepID=A0A9P3PQ15_LYOSH|nr:putative class-II DAHP synthase family protein [Lyophyllum shimeji]
MSGEAPWRLDSWKEKPAAQPVEYPDHAHLDRVLAKLGTLPPLVTPSEIERLRYQLGLAQRNEAFVLHAGDCAESFDACTQENISAKIGLILSFSLILIWGARLPVVRIGRIAGQYAKPRSSAYERIGEREVLSFRGDNVNGLDINERTPDPERLLSAYFHSTATLNYVRGLLSSGFASLHHPRDWSLAHVRSPALRREFSQIIDDLGDALDFSRTIGADAFAFAAPYERGGARNALAEVDFYTSHEGLMLAYEQALTRELPVPGSGSGSPTAPPSPSPSPASPAPAPAPAPAPPTKTQIQAQTQTKTQSQSRKRTTTPLRTSCGSATARGSSRARTWSISVGYGIRLLEIVNPDREPGRVTLITRYGASKIQDHLPAHIASVQASGHPVVWICDPMHGNTQTSASGLKTRHFGTIVTELAACLRIHAEAGSRLGGVSLEFTGELNEEGFSVTECVGGSMELGEEELGLRYQSFCDPRLNFEQSLDVAFLISNHFKKERRGTQGEGDVLYTELAGRFAAAATTTAAK